MKALVFLEHHEHAISPGSLGVLTRAAALDPDDRFQTAVLLPAFVVAWAVVILAAVTEPGWWFARAVNRRPLCGLGRISYGLYLWHWPVFVVADSSRLHLDGAALLSAQLVLTFAIAAASFYLVERPIRRGWPRDHRSSSAPSSR